MTRNELVGWVVGPPVIAGSLFLVGSLSVGLWRSVRDGQWGDAAVILVALWFLIGFGVLFVHATWSDP